MPTVHFVKQDVTVECPVGTNLRELALANEIDLYSFPNNVLNCRGRGLCGTCRVKVDEPRALSARTPVDERKTAWEGPHYRLACQSKVLFDVNVTTNPRRALGWTHHPTYQWLRNEPG
jgi:ferredoxin